MRANLNSLDSAGEAVERTPCPAVLGSQGQASVKVSRKAPTAQEPERIVIEAGCDSLELVCARYAKTISTLKRQLKIASDSKAEHKEEAKESTGNGFLMRLKYFLAGLLAGVIGIVYTFIKLKKK